MENRNYLEERRAMEQKHWSEYYRFEPTWDAMRVRQVCIANDFYTRGDNADYTQMLDYVNNHERPTPYDVHLVAEDIARHSKQMHDFFAEDIETVAFELTTHAIIWVLGNTEDGYDE